MERGREASYQPPTEARTARPQPARRPARLRRHPDATPARNPRVVGTGARSGQAHAAGAPDHRPGDARARKRSRLAAQARQWIARAEAAQPPAQRNQIQSGTRSTRAARARTKGTRWPHGSHPSRRRTVLPDAVALGSWFGAARLVLRPGRARRQSGSASSAAAELGKPYGTVRDWWKGLRANHSSPRSPQRAARAGWCGSRRAGWIGASCSITIPDRRDFSDQEPVSAEISATRKPPRSQR